MNLSSIHTMQFYLLSKNWSRVKQIHWPRRFEMVDIAQSLFGDILGTGTNERLLNNYFYYIKLLGHFDCR